MGVLSTRPRSWRAGQRQSERDGRVDLGGRPDNNRSRDTITVDDSGSGAQGVGASNSLRLHSADIANHGGNDEVGRDKVRVSIVLRVRVVGRALVRAGLQDGVGCDPLSGRARRGEGDNIRRVVNNHARSSDRDSAVEEARRESRADSTDGHIVGLIR